jgi:DNA polymerase I
MGIKPPRKTATGHSTDADTLEILQLEYPIAGKIMEYRTLEKLRSTYIDTLPSQVNPKTHRIHCTFNQSVAATGRLSCQDPNLQNIPIRTEIGSRLREAFRPQKEGWVYLAGDYSQIELRLLAHFSEDPTMMKAFQNHEDIHAHTAAEIFHVPLNQVTKEQRYHAKAVNFGVIYGQQAFGLAREKEYVESCKDFARQNGKAVTYMGRERLIPDINSKNGQIRSVAERLAVNTPLQGTAADLIKMAMLQVDEKLDKHHMKGLMILQIHDELIFELPTDESDQMKKMVKEAMEGVLNLKVPLVVDITVGKNWKEC